MRFSNRIEFIGAKMGTFGWRVNTSHYYIFYLKRIILAIGPVSGPVR